MKPVRRTWIWRFSSPPSAVWRILADTVRFNEAAKLPRYRIEEAPQADGRVRYYGNLVRGPFRVRWEEKPVDWVSEQRFTHRRVFDNGPLVSLCATLDLTPEEKGSRVAYTVEIIPRNALVRFALACGGLARTGRDFGRIAAGVDAHLAGSRPQPYDVAPPQLGAVERGRVDGLVQRIEATAHGHGLARRLADHLIGAQENELARIRPLALARVWGADGLALVECCLESTRAGLLYMRWDLLCPNCRGAKRTVAALDELPTGAHCPSCNISYDRDFARNVELTFQPAPGVRPLGQGEFCLFGPMSTPHVKVQQTLAPGETRTLAARLSPGPYRLRTLHPSGEALVEFGGDGFPEVVFDGERVSAGPLSSAGEIRLANRSDREVVLLVESRAWLEDALTAHRVTTMQAFRDLFADQVLRPGDEVAINHVALLFTDLKGSTALYGRVGDAGAYQRVREHFAVLAGAVRANGGAIVKTIGDAVMAAFVAPAEAVRAALAIQRDIAAWNARQAGEPIIVKVGVHAGPCIAVTLNERLDYFGSTVNLAARLQGESEGADIVLSEAVAADPEVDAALRGLARQSASARVRGFAAAIRYVRIRPEALVSAAG
jgi:class 3 adenylate cyclase